MASAPTDRAGRSTDGGAASHSVQIGKLLLRIPEGYDLLLRSDPAHAAEVDGFVNASPDRSLYHLPAYIDFARAENGCGDLGLIKRAGRAMAALPLHPQRGRWCRTGYSGIAFPAGQSEAVLNRGIQAVLALFAANPGLGFDVVQSVQAPAYDDLFRAEMLDSLLTGPGLTKTESYCRIIRGLVADSHAPPPAAAITSEELENALLRGYESDVRNQIRQAMRHGVRVSYELLSESDDEPRAAAAYDAYLSIHRTSWQRTGLQPHANAHWLALSAAVCRAGGRDLVVLAQSEDGTPVAGVTCHLFQGRALYWSSGSVAEGLRLRANPLCLHAAITMCRRAGIETFEIGRFDNAERSPKERTVTAYKAQFRGSVVRVVNVHRSPQTTRYRMRRTAGRIVRTLTQAVRKPH